MNSIVTDHINRITEEFFISEPIPGLAVGVVYNNEIIYAKGFGVKNIDTKEPVNENSLFHMASVSKLFVGTAIMQLVEQGKVALDSSIVEYLPYFKMNDSRYKDITVRQILSHTSGMPDEEDYQWDKPKYGEDALEIYVRSIKDRELLWEPGKGFAYSNIGFEILGDIIAKVTKSPFEKYIKDNILDVLNMKESNFLKPVVSQELLASPHILDIQNGYGARLSEIFPYNRAHGPSSTLCSNVVEMCSFAIANINKGKLGNAKILDADTYSELWKEHTATDWGGFRENVGLTWFLGDYKGNRVMSHSGMDTGFRSNFIILPEKEIAIIIMTNSDYIGLNIICTSILDVLLGDKADNVKKSLAHRLAKLLFEKDVEKALEEYNNIREKSINDYLVLEGEFNFIAYELLERKRIKEAIEMIKMSVNIFPESSNLYDSLGKMYLLNGNKELALEHYKKSIELNPDNVDGKRAIDSIING